MNVVYLSGPITGHSYKEATSWRAYATEVLSQAGFTVLDPMRGKSFLSHQTKIASEHPSRSPRLSDRALRQRDRSDVAAADIILCNLAGVDIVSVGSVMEIAWADASHKHIILVDQPGSVHDHPFIRDAGVRFPDLEAALVYIIGCKV